MSLVSEKKGDASHNFHNMKMFREVVEELPLRDLGYEGDVFTWSNKGKDCIVILKRLDHFLGNYAFSDLFLQCRVSHLDWYSSDHRPICLKVNNVHERGGEKRFTRTFRFEELWLLNEECRSIVEKCWGVGPEVRHFVGGAGVDFHSLIDIVAKGYRFGGRKRTVMCLRTLINRDRFSRMLT